MSRAAFLYKKTVRDSSKAFGVRRLFSSDVSVEVKIALEFQPTFVDVKDVSGGCGAMFNITVESEKFKGVSLVNQHKMVTRVLSNEIKDMHGLTVKTSVPK